MGSLAVNWIRLALAWGFFAAYGLLFRGLTFPIDASAHAWFWLFLSGLVGLFVGDLCLVKAFMLIGPRLSMLLMSLAPPMTALLGLVFLQEKLGIWNWLGILVTILGTSWVIVERKVEPDGLRRRPKAAGIFLAMMGALGQATQLVISKYGMGDFDAFAATQIRVTAAFAAFTVLLFCLRWYPRVFSTLRQPRVMGWISLGSFAGSFLGVSLLLLSVQYIPTGVAQTFASMVPVMIIPLVVVFYRERVSWRAVLGALIAVGGVVLLFLG